MEGLWEERFSELAAYNGDNDKTKYTDEYKERMAIMQAEYNKKQKLLALARGYIVIEI